MTGSKKIALSIVIPLAIILIILLSLFLVYGIDILKDAFEHRDWTKIDYCNDSWDVKIPNATIEYTFSSCGGFNGDGETYTVCRYSSIPSEFLQNFTLDSKGENLEKYNSISTLLQSSNIDKSKLIEPDENYIWMSKTKNSNNTLLLAYNQQTNTLYIIEQFI
ncbi:MAG: hypothetical protein K2I46_00710 [Clostridia bacterium]|nr:hypothetical protein [Clostridia bacterium]